MTLLELVLFMADLCTTTAIALNRDAKGLPRKTRNANRRAADALAIGSADLMAAAGRLPIWLSTYAFTPEDQISLFTTPDFLCDTFGDTVARIKPRKAIKAKRK